MNLAGARLARAAADEWEAKTGSPRFVAGSVGPLNVALSLSPQGRRPRLPRLDLRRGRRGVRAPDPGPARGRGGPAPDRDRLRHAEREGGDRRRAGRCAGAAALALVHRGRQERPQPLRPDGRGVLDLRRARAAARRRRQLLAGGGRDASVRRGPRGDRARRGLRATRTRACRTSSDCTTSSRRTRAGSSASSRGTAS